MAKLIDPIALMERPRNVPMYIERWDEPGITFRVSWRYDEKYHLIGILGARVGYDIDDYNLKWRAWDAFPTQVERKAEPWLQEVLHREQS